MRPRHAVLTGAGGLLLVLGAACSSQGTAAPPPVTVTVIQPAPQAPASNSASPSTGPSGSGGSDGCFASYRTTQASVRLCRDSGQIFYHGTSSGQSIELPATAIGTGVYQTVPNNGYTYTISSSELVIRLNGSVISSQPVVSQQGYGYPYGSSSATDASSAPQVPGAEEACGRLHERGSAVYQQCVGDY